MKSWDVLVVGGPSGVGKSQLSYPLARHFDVPLVEVDDLVHAVLAMTRPSDYPDLHYWESHPEAARLTPERILEIHLATCRSLAPAVLRVIGNHIETCAPIILDGDYVLPEMLSDDEKRVRSVFVYESDEDQIVANYRVREPASGEQSKRARVSKLFGDWLRTECERHGLPTLPARPWSTGLERAIGAVNSRAPR